MTDAIVCEELTREFPSGRAVDRLTFAVPQGAVLALLGPNGAGKTTSIRLMNGILAPDSGTCRVMGLDPQVNGTELRARTGVVTENAGLDDRLTARENLEITGRLRGLGAKRTAEIVDDLLERFDMTSHADHRCQGFSTGQRRRVSLARALIHDPEMLFLDEPTSGLDPAGARAVMELINRSARERGRTIVLCTHFLSEAGSTADWMAVMHQGRLVSFGRPAELATARWPGLEVHFDLGGPPDELTRSEISALPSVLSTEVDAVGLVVTVTDRAQIPGVVAALVGLGATVYGTQARPRGLEDVYFDVQSRYDSSAITSLVDSPALTS